MIVNTHVTNALLSAGDKAKYDAEAKELASDKQVLAWVMQYTVAEFRNMSIAEIIPCIEGEPQVSAVPVYPGQTDSEKITGSQNEDAVPNEGKVVYDIRFYAITPQKERIKILLNMEVQKNFYPGYDVVTRAVFYCARMISSQMDTEFTGEDYDGIKKVYSIWICMDCPNYAANTITEYKITPYPIYGEFKGKARYDLLSAVIICLAKGGYAGERTELHKMLDTLFSETLPIEQKLSKLNRDFGIQTTRIEKEVKSMCNLSDRIEERGIRKGYLNAAMLIQKLNEAGRLNDIERAMTDEDYRAALFQEFGIIPAITAQAQARAEAQALQ